MPSSPTSSQESRISANPYKDPFISIEEYDISVLTETADGQASISKRLLETESSLSQLETLPAELRLKVLMCMPDLPSLRSSVHASPTLHAQYLHNRDSILRACLDRELDGCFIDACANLKSRVREIGSPRTDEKITNFLGTYHGWLSASAPLPDVNSIDPGNIRWMARYHRNIARPLTRLYSKWALTNLRKATTTPTALKGGPESTVTTSNYNARLTRSEKIRIFQALYRYETYHHLFSRNQARRHGEYRHHEINELFFGPFNPWEAEAIGCIDMFVRQSYEDIFNKVEADLAPSNPRYMQPDGVYNISDSFDLRVERDDFMDGTVSRGLKMIVRLLAIEDHDELVAKMDRCLTHYEYKDDTAKKALSAEAQEDRRQMSPNFPDAKDEAQERRDPMYFAGDAVPPDGPPMAWVELWDGQYANIYGECVPVSLQRWGYVMWDESRWTDMGAKKLIAMQWYANIQLVEEIIRDYAWSPLELRILNSL